MTQKNTLLVAAYEALKEAQHTLSGLEAIIVGMEDDLNAVEAMGAKIDGLEARIVAECKATEEMWAKSRTWEERARYLAQKLVDNGIQSPAAMDALRVLNGDGDGDD